MPHSQAPVIVRRCTVSDAPALTALARSTFSDTFTGTCSEADLQDFLDTFYNERRISAELEDPSDYIFFAESAGTPLGYLRFIDSPLQFQVEGAVKPLELNRLYVDAAFKGKGIAQQLMDFYLAFARDHGYDFLWLGVWEHNHRAQAFYRRYGFSFTGHSHPFPIGNTPQTDEWWALSLKKSKHEPNEKP